MKIIEKISLALFANIILIISVLLCLVIFGWLNLNVIHEMVVYAIQNHTISSIILGVCIVLILLAIKCIFFDTGTSNQEKSKDGILLENDSGKLMISRDTLENLANSVVKNFENTENITSRVVLDKENNVTVLVSLSVKPEAVIKDLSNHLQNKIKEAIKTSLDLDVKEVNIRIKNIAPKVESTKGGTENE